MQSVQMNEKYRTLVFAIFISSSACQCTRLWRPHQPAHARNCSSGGRIARAAACVHRSTRRSGRGTSASRGARALPLRFQKSSASFLEPQSMLVVQILMIVFHSTLSRTQGCHECYDPYNTRRNDPDITSIRVFNKEPLPI